MVEIKTTVCAETYSGTDDNIKMKFRGGHSNGEAADECETEWLDSDYTPGCLGVICATDIYLSPQTHVQSLMHNVSKYLETSYMKYQLITANRQLLRQLGNRQEGILD